MIMSKDRFTEQWTQKTFTNVDGDKMRIEHDKDDCGVMSICIGDEEFWFDKKHATHIAETLQEISGN